MLPEHASEASAAPVAATEMPVTIKRRRFMDSAKTPFRNASYASVAKAPHDDLQRTTHPPAQTSDEQVN
jgi:hypothetical protein